MVVQKNWNSNEASLQNSESESSTTTLSFQVPRTVNDRNSAANIMQTVSAEYVLYYFKVSVEMRPRP